MKPADDFDDVEGPYPRKFGRYQLLSSLGHGGMGEVYLAKQPQMEGIERYCVVKRMRVGRGRRAQVERFLDEARVVVQLNHRNICRVFDIGEVDDDLFLAMDLVAGRDVRAIRARLAERGQRLPMPLALLLVKELLVALDYAHRLKHPATGEPLHLVHRDVSPHNVMVSYEGEVALIDFGLAASTLKEHKTSKGQAFGKLAYMAPEQLKGTGSDARTDLYAAGIVLFELVTGTSFFGRRTPDDLLAAFREGRLLEPDWSLLPDGLVPVLRRAVAAAPDDRYPSCAELRSAVEAFEREIGASATDADLRAFMDQLYPEGPQELRAIMSRYSTQQVAQLPSPPDDEPERDATTIDAAPVDSGDTSLVVNDTWQSPPDADETELVTRRGRAAARDTEEAPPPATDDGTAPVLTGRSKKAPMLVAAAALLLVVVVGSLTLLGGEDEAANLPPAAPVVRPAPADVGEPAAPPPPAEAPVTAETDDAEPIPDDSTALDDGSGGAGWEVAPDAEPAPRRERKATRTRRTRRSPATKPVLRNNADKLEFLRSCRRPCAKRVTARAKDFPTMPQQEAREWFDALDRCVRACGG